MKAKAEPKVVRTSHFVVTMSAERDPEDPNYPLESTITSDLRKESVPCVDWRETGAAADRYAAAVEALENMVLAHAEAGIDISSADYMYGIETAVDKLFDQYGNLK